MADSAAKELARSPVSSLLARYSIPATIGMIMHVLYGVMDWVFVGQGVADEAALGGLTAAFPLQILLAGIAVGCGVGGASVLSRALGTGDFERGARIAGTCFSSMLIVGTVFLVIGGVALKPLLLLCGANAATMPHALPYVAILLPGAPLFCYGIAASSLARAEGRAKTAMYAMIVGGSINLALDPLLIFGMGMGTKGAAIASLGGQLGTFAYLAGHFNSRNSSLRIGWHHLRIDTKELWEVTSLGRFVVRTVASALDPYPERSRQLPVFSSSV